ncbi:hypothetical protein GSI_13292 [Ganoderma sinense ZZ0214-1]|uniref:DUF8212 domain-containing protein n=1 Tax=Ganoderma sinense ZZ0214-1 TaxID=1077348 RepID=A0A2G8RV57_9APHY|nr:hypothetical protein GSI_13292 [Ganoderma sinense ZZ0214-1]
MFAWYRDAAVCYAFLSDVPTLPAPSLRSEGSPFRSSVWFTRGWTLQELIAPARLVFFSQTWELLGTKASLAGLVEEITSIPVSVLTGCARGPHRSLDECSVAQRMSWAANRQATKVEDQAYSLLGIFDIQMPTLYGEGERAFRRLQEEILRRIPDQTIFAWGPVYPDAFPKLATSSGPDNKVTEAKTTPKDLDLPSSEPRIRYMFTTSGSSPILAQSPRDFTGAGKVVSVPYTHFVDLLTRYWPISPQEYTSTPHGIRTSLPLLPLATCLPPAEASFEVKDAQRVRWYLAVLACEQSGFPGHLLACVCHVAAPEQPVNVLHRGALRLPGQLGSYARDFGIVRLASLNEPWLVQLRVHTVFLDHPSRALPTSFMQRIQDARSASADSECHEPETVAFALPTWCQDALSAQGYAASLEGPSEGGEGESAGGGSYRLVLTRAPALQPPSTTTATNTTNPESELESDRGRWSIAADFSYEWMEGLGLDGLCILAAVRVHYISGTGTGKGEGVWDRHTKHLEWTHVNSLWPSPGWHCRLMSERLELVVGHLDPNRDDSDPDTVTLELGVQLASAFCYHIYADIISEPPAE